MNVTNITHPLSPDTRAAIARLLDAAGITARARPESVADLLAVATVQRLPANHFFCHRGEAVSSLILILEGKVEVSLCSAEGKRSILWYLGPGQAVNLIPVLDGEPAIHDFRAHTDVSGVVFPRSAIIAGVSADPGLGLAFLGVLCARSRALYDNMAADGLLTLPARVARMIVLMLERHGQPGTKGTSIALKLSQDEFADMLGIARQSLSRELKTLAQAGIISLAYSHITVLDEPALRRAMNWEGASAP